MAYRFCEGDLGGQMLRIEGANHLIEFCVDGVREESREWLAQVLEEQVESAIKRNVDKAVAEQQKALRKLCGLPN